MNMPFYVPIYTEEYINCKLTYSHSKLVNFTILMNKWTALKLLQNFEFLQGKKNCTLKYIYICLTILSNKLKKIL
jgi:hypothetical protein